MRRHSLIGMLTWGVLFVAADAAAQAPTANQLRMKQCADLAGSRQGSDRTAFMRACITSDSPPSAPADAQTQGNLTASGFSGTADGFEFSVDGSQAVGVGGPCVSAGIKRFTFTVVPSFVQWQRGTFRTQYVLTGHGELPQNSGPPLDVLYTFDANFDWAGQLAAVAQQRRRLSDGGAPIECLARSHSKYVEAAENWMRINKSMIQKQWGAQIKEMTH
ncbi:hypothetical protein PPN31114_03670 [Pandoraea pneumonica]|jgi:hypothetical protein|uniref:Lipoprotein n=1 Tax=Pandoraea pneumonica TaxID=2508299 RepID=A0A5E4X4B7_9BURK|nr:PsiF family protein [Pandoraea pneumonica]VVE31201.1 hypothetical protein PPN31114_03670 [Pandoraea pneumonica]